jgi:hypothetical protein
MGVSAAIFQTAGKRTEHYVPGAYSRSLAVGGAGSGVSANNAVILGESEGGQGNKLFTFSSVEEAKETLVSGELLNAVAHAFNPSPEYSPQAIRAMVVNQNTQAESILRSGGKPVLKLTSASYGRVANRISKRIDGNEKGKKITFFAGEEKETIDIGDEETMSVRYIGDTGRAILSVDNNRLFVRIDGQVNDDPFVEIRNLQNLRVGESRIFKIRITNPEEVSISKIGIKIEMNGIGSDCLKVEQYGNYKSFDLDTPYAGTPGSNGIHIEGGAYSEQKFQITPTTEGIMEYSVTIVNMEDGSEITSTTVGEITIAAEGAEYIVYAIQALDVHTGDVYIDFDQYPTIKDVVLRLKSVEVLDVECPASKEGTPSRELDYISSESLLRTANETKLKSNFYALVHALEKSPWIGKVEKVAGAQNQMPDNDDEPVYFGGASHGIYNVEAFIKTLDLLKTENIQIISTPATDPDIHTLISNHCTEMSNVQNRKERTAILGGTGDGSIEDALGAAKALDNKLVSYVYPAAVALSPLTGKAEDIPASLVACKLLGMEASVAVNEPLTWKTLGVLGFKKKLKISEMEKLIAGGVLCGGTTDDNRLAVIRAMTTHQGDQLQLVERSMVREDLYMNRDLRQIFSRGVGKPYGNISVGTAKQTVLDAARHWKGDGLITPTDKGENVWGVVAWQSGDKMYISFSRNLTAPQNFFFITAYNFVYESATTVEVPI